MFLFEVGDFIFRTCSLSACRKKIKRLYREYSLKKAQHLKGNTCYKIHRLLLEIHTFGEWECLVPWLVGLFVCLSGEKKKDFVLKENSLRLISLFPDS